MDDIFEELKRRHEQEILNFKSYKNKFSNLFDSDFPEIEELLTTYKPELDKDEIEFISKSNEPTVTFNEINDKLEILTIHRPNLNKEILRIPKVSSSPTEPFITIENPTHKEEVITIHKLKENDEKKVE